MEASYTKKWIFKISLLSISLMTMIAPAISPALPLMYRAFPGYSNSAVETLLTVPNFGIMICLFLSPLIISFIGEKKTVVIGLVLALAAGHLSDVFQRLCACFCFALFVWCWSRSV